MLFFTALQVAGILPPVDGSLTMTVITDAITAALLALVAVKIAAGRGWVRWLYLIVYAAGTAFTVVFFLAVPKAFHALSPALQVNVVAQSALQTSALIFMFTAASRAWFRAADERAVS